MKDGDDLERTNKEGLERYIAYFRNLKTVLVPYARGIRKFRFGKNTRSVDPLIACESVTHSNAGFSCTLEKLVMLFDRYLCLYQFIILLMVSQDPFYFVTSQAFF
jgi:hypothetical protein